MKRIFASFFLFVMVSLVIWQCAGSPVVEKLIVEHFDQELDQYYRSLVKGIYSRLLKDIDALHPDQWAGYIRQIQPEFGYPLAIVPVADLTLQTKEQDLLHQGGIVVVRDGEWFYQRLKQSGFALAMGPLPNFNTPLRIEALFWSILVVYFGVMALVWSLPFWLNLRRISGAAQRFGKADFSARAQISKRSALFPLAGSFNDMAGKIQQLIASHKALTHAVSHELRTPTSRIRFSLEMLEHAKDQSEKDESIAQIRTDIDELDSLVSELLIYAKFDRETPLLERSELPVGPWLEQIAQKAEKSSGHIRVDVHIPDRDRDCRIMAAVRYMSRAVDNLVQNAVKHAADRVEIRFENAEDACLIRVDDDGPGIPVKDYEKIFEPFVRLDTSRSRETGGYGLGLSIVRRIAVWHNGTVHAGKSALGGAGFTIRLPRGDKKEQPKHG